MTLHVCIPLYDRRSECGLHISLARPPTEDRGCVAGRRAHNVLVMGVRPLCVINSERRTTVLEIYWRIVVGDVTAAGALAVSPRINLDRQQHRYQYTHRHLRRFHTPSRSRPSFPQASLRTRYVTQRMKTNLRIKLRFQHFCYIMRTHKCPHLTNGHPVGPPSQQIATDVHEAVNWRCHVTVRFRGALINNEPPSSNHVKLLKEQILSVRRRLIIWAPK